MNLLKALAQVSSMTLVSRILGFARDAVRRALDTPLAEGLKIEADLSTLAYQTRDAAEGMAAFMEKRPARFEDR